MPDLSQSLRRLKTEFALSKGQLVTIASLFRQEMADGLAGRSSSLAMLPSYLARPTGREHGTYLALDFGGTNVRALSVELMGDGSHRVLSRRSMPLADLEGSYDFTAGTATANELFGFLAAQLAEIAFGEGPYFLGHSFSFPCRQTGVNSASLLRWTKEIKTAGVEGRDLTELLSTALQERGLGHIQPVALLNDSVSTLIAAAYRESETDIGSICGTGHNTCYLEPSHPWVDYPMYINIEAGNFDKVDGNHYDIIVDQMSEKPGASRLEKMCSGRYVGELFRLVVQDLAKQGLLFNGPTALEPFSQITGADLALILGDDSPDLEQIALWLDNHGQTGRHSMDDRSALRTVASLIANRSARLVAATYTAVVQHIDPVINHDHAIAIDGSLYEKMPGYARTIRLTLNELLGDKSSRVRVYLTKDGSGVGAAVAAATVRPLN